MLGLVGGAVLDIYSSGLSLLAAGLRVPRSVAARIDGVLMMIGTIVHRLLRRRLPRPFQGFLITLGVPIAAWCGIMLADIACVAATTTRPTCSGRRAATATFGRCRRSSCSWRTAVGWGLVTNTAASWLNWQGYLLGPLGLGGKSGAWAFANLGVLVALLIGFAVTLLSLATVRAQEARPTGAGAAGAAGAETVQA